MNMKRALLGFLATLILCVPLVYAATFQDDFNRADNSDLGANWDSGYPDADPLQIVGGKVRVTNLGTDARETATASLGNNQFAQVEVVTLPDPFFGGGRVEWMVTARSAAPADLTNYECVAYMLNPLTTTTQLAKRVNGTFTELGATTINTWAPGDVLKLTVSGTTISCYQNSDLILQTTDGGLTSGRVGLAMFLSPDTHSIHNLEIDNFQGGDLGAVRVRRRPIIWR
jgi:hypothetical protein